MKTTHNLPFEEAGHFFEKYGGHDGYEWKNFRVGTCEGLWTQKDGAYHILAVENREPHNGHLDDVFEWFMASAERDGFKLIVHEIMNPAMGRILLRRGFTPVFGTRNFQWNP